MKTVFSFRRAFDLALQGYKVRAVAWSPEYYFTFSEGELWLMPQRKIIVIRELNIWRQNYTMWELYGKT